MAQPSRRAKAGHARYFVPDLTPMAHPEARNFRPRVIFVAESPHINEVEPEEESQRRPLCGAAGRAWWGKLSELLEGERNTEVSLERLLDFTRRHHLAVMNAVQLPLDPKIAQRFPDADPVKTLHFAKTTGEFSYKRQKKSEAVQKAIADLRARLTSGGLEDLPVVPLGNDAEWFVRQALTPEEAEIRLATKVPHPSAWWRQGGLFERIAEEKLRPVLSKL